MQANRWYVMGVILAAVCCASVATYAEDKPAGTAGAPAAATENKGPKLGGFTGAAKAANATAEQQTKLEAAYEPIRVARAKGKDAAAKLKAATDEAAKTTAKAEVDAAKTEQDAAELQFNKTVRTILKPEQIKAWEQDRLNFSVKTSLGKATVLTAEQQTTVNGLVAAAAEKRAGTELSDPKYDLISKDLLDSIKKTVLTDAQREALGKKPEAKPAAATQLAPK